MPIDNILGLLNLPVPPKSQSTQNTYLGREETLFQNHIGYNSTAIIFFHYHDLHMYEDKHRNNVKWKSTQMVRVQLHST